MTKRIAVILCVLALLLAGCSKPGEAIPETSDQSCVPSGPEPAQNTEIHRPTDEAAETGAPTEPDPTALVPEESVAQSVTRGGYKVHIDTSHYTPYQPPESKFIRPEGVDLSEFNPENANGPVYPYATDVLYSNNEGGYGSASGYHFGFFDATGTLVTDGIYTNCAPFESWDYETEVRTTLPLWLVSRAGEIRLFHYEDENYSYDIPEGTILQGIVAMDGSFCIPCEYLDVVAEEDRLICVRDYETKDYVVYDLNGNLLLTTDGLFDPSSEWKNFHYGEGLYVISNGYSLKKPEAYYVTESGQRVLGPYQSAKPFRDGIACVSVDGEKYGFIDKTGAWVIPPIYDSIDNFVAGTTIAREESRSLVIDREGNVLLEKTAGTMGYFSRSKYGFTYSEGEYSEIYDSDCNLLMSGYGDWFWLDETVFYRNQGNGSVLHSLDEAIPDLFVPNARYLNKGHVYFEGSLHEGYVYEDSSEQVVMYVPLDLSGWQQIEKDRDDWYFGYINMYDTRDQITGEDFCFAREDGKWLIFNSSLEQVCTSDAGFPNVIDGMIRNLDGLSCTYMTMDGQLLFSFPYLGGGD